MCVPVMVAGSVATDVNTIAELNDLNDDLEDTADNLEDLEIEFADGRLKLGGGKSTSKKAGTKPPEQGSLF